MVSGALLDQYDKAWIMSGDDDFIYAAQKVRGAGKYLGLLALSNRYAYGMSHYSNRVIVADYRAHFTSKVGPHTDLRQIPLTVREFDGLVRVNKI